MASTNKRLKNRELLLLVADAAGGILSGRTIAQKLLYFSGVALKQPTGHTAYFYGPYSDEFEAALNRAVLAGELDERVEFIPDWYGGPDATKHVYSLTESGRAAVEQIASHNADAASTVRETVAAIGSVVPEFRQKTLSAAAKIHLIVSEQQRRLTADELRRFAKDLGWQLRQEEVTEAINALASLKLVTVSTPTPNS